MAETDGVVMAGVQDQQQPPPPRPVERLNQAVQQQLNLDSVKTRAISLFKAISRILEDFDAIARTNASPKWYSNSYFESNQFLNWKAIAIPLLLFPQNLIFGFYVCRQDILGQFSMVNLELYNIVEDIKNVSKAFVVHPKNVNAENATSMLPSCRLTTHCFPFDLMLFETRILHIFVASGVFSFHCSVMISTTDGFYLTWH